MSLSDDDLRRFGEQAEEEQTQAGMERIVKATRQFQGVCERNGFTGKQAFRLARDFLNALMESVDSEED